MASFKIDPSVSSPFVWYAAYEIAELHNHLHPYDKKGDVEWLHRIRIALKKIKAVRKTLGYRDKTAQHKKNTRILQQLFKTAGRLREVQVERKLLNDWHLDEVASQIGLDKKEERLRRAFEKLVAKEEKQITKSLQRIQKGTHEVRRKDFRAHLKATENKLRKSLEKMPDEKDWHDIRKQIKELLYGVKWVKEDDAVLPDAAFLVYLKELEIQIGYWHDCLLLIHRIDRSDKKKFADTTEKERILATCREQLDLSGNRVRILIP